MALLIEFSIDDNCYAMKFPTQTAANEYLNSLTRKLKSDDNLEFFRHTTKNGYILSTGSKTALIELLLDTNNKAYYELDYSEDNNYVKSYKSNDLDKLIKLVHKDLHDASEYEDATGKWTDGDNANTAYTLYIVYGDNRVRYTDMLATLDFYSSPLIMDVLGEAYDDYKLPRITKPSSSLVFSALESFLLAWLGIAICLIGTNSYINTTKRLYGGEYLIGNHLKQTIINNIAGLIIGLILNCLCTLAMSDSLDNRTFNWPMAIIFAIICLLVFPCLYIKADTIDNE